MEILLSILVKISVVPGLILLGTILHARSIKKKNRNNQQQGMNKELQAVRRYAIYGTFITMLSSVSAFWAMTRSVVHVMDSDAAQGTGYFVALVVLPLLAMSYIGLLISIIPLAYSSKSVIPFARKFVSIVFILIALVGFSLVIGNGLIDLFFGYFMTTPDAVILIDFLNQSFLPLWPVLFLFGPAFLLVAGVDGLRRK